MLTVNKYTWIVVANGSGCKIFSGRNKRKGLRLIKGLYSATSHLKTTNLGTERPGRVQESGNPMRHSIEPKADLHHKEKIIFLDLIAIHLNKEASYSTFYQLILISSPEVLGVLRKKLNKNTSSLILKEINKDLTHAKEREIMEALC